VAVDLDDAAVAGSIPARHPGLPSELRTWSPSANRLEHRLRSARKHVAGILWKQLGDEARLDHDLGAWKKTSGLGMAFRPKPEDGGWIAERGSEIRHRRNSDPTCNEERPVDVEIEAVSERAEDMDCLAGSKCAERARAGPDRVDEKRELTRRRLAEAHRTREHSSGRLEHEELTWHSGLELSSLEPQHRVRADGLGCGDRQALPTSFPSRK
jgi:hypothetical protein